MTIPLWPYSPLYLSIGILTVTIMRTYLMKLLLRTNFVSQPSFPIYGWALIILFWPALWLVAGVIIIGEILNKIMRVLRIRL